MAKYTIGISLDNAASFDNFGVELARILKGLAHQCAVADGPVATTIRDINGNVVGAASVDVDSGMSQIT